MIRVVGIAGGTASGKSTLAQQIRTALGSERCALLGQDHYYRDLAHLPYEERGKMNFDHPDSLETSLLVDHLRALRAGRSVDVPVYDFSAHARTDDTERKRPAKIVLVEGILIYSAPELLRRERYDERVDVWAFACVLECLWTQKAVYAAEVERADGLLQRIADSDEEDRKR